MTVSYVDPLRRAYERMVRMLFRPFRLRTWFVLGFSAFLSALTSGGTGGRYNYNKVRGISSWEGVTDKAAELLRDPFWSALFAGIGIVVLVIAVVCVWASSRGKFVFVDNVVHERAAFVEPWRRFGRLGNSLFWWWLGFAAIFVALVVAASIPIWPAFQAVREGDSFDPSYFPILFMVLGLEVPIVLAAVLIGGFATSFVVPIMYRNDITVLPAWGRLLALVGRHLGSFILFVLFTMVLFFVIGTAILVAGFATCCVGFLLLAIPYFGVVLMLPIYVTMRAYTLEFLAQFGDEYSVFTQPPLVNEAP